MSDKRKRKPRQTIELEQLKNDPNSFLKLHAEDEVLHKLETYRLYQEGYAAEDIAETFGYARAYLYEMWRKFEREGVRALVKKSWGSAPRKRTTEREAEVLRAKALRPERSDSNLAQEFEMDRSTIYRLLQEHGLQDLHRVLDGEADSQQAPSPGEESKKGG